MDLKELGNEFYKKGEYEKALVAYNDGIKYMNKIMNRKKKNKERLDENEFSKLRIDLLSNCAATKLKLGQFSQAEKDCSAILITENNNRKALFRRASAYIEMKDINGAYKDLRHLLDIDKNCKEAAELMKKLIKINQKMKNFASKLLEIINDDKNYSNNFVESTGNLNLVFNSIQEDEYLAQQLAVNNACRKLWENHHKNCVVLKIMNKMSYYDTCHPFMLESITEVSLKEIIDDANHQPERAARALNILWRLCKYELQKHNDNHMQHISIRYTLQSLANALKMKQESLWRVGIDGIIGIVSSKELATMFIEFNGLIAIFSLISQKTTSNEHLEVTSIILSHILKFFKKEDWILNNILMFCKPLLNSENVFDQLRAVSILNSIYISSEEFGIEMVIEKSLWKPLLRLSKIGVERTQELICRILSNLGNSEKGRTLLREKFTDILKFFSNCQVSGIRSVAIVCFAKISALKFSLESDQGKSILISIHSLLNNKANVDEHIRGIEAMACLISNYDVKMLLIKGDGLDVLKKMIQLGIDLPQESLAYGLAFCFETFLRSENDEQSRKLREIGVSRQQWEQFEQLAKNQIPALEKRDCKNSLEIRTKMFVESNGVVALQSLTHKSISHRVWDLVSQTFCNIAKIQDIRSQIIAQGGLKALFKLSNHTSHICKKFSSHALAKILITTNPNILRNDQIMDFISPLVQQIRNYENELIVFECCMALTNIATVSFESKEKIVDSCSIQTFEYALYSENIMVRRATIELMNNLIPTNKIVEWFCMPNKLKVWLMFIESSEDINIPITAIGALANLAYNEQVAKVILQEEELVKVLVNLMKSENINKSHRAVVCLLGLIQTWPSDERNIVIKKTGAVDAFQKVIENNRSELIVKDAKKCLDILV